MQRLFLLAVTCAVGCLMAQRPELNDGEAHGDPPFLIEDGWRPLLNGRDTGGWKGQGGPHEWFTTKGVRWERLLGPTRLAGVREEAGTMLNGPTGRTQNLVTEEKFGDIELYLEFMLAKGSNSGVYLHGLYEIQLFDSYGSSEPMKTSDCGAVYHRWINNQGVGGSPPSRNASRRPGEWQSLQIWFRAPALTRAEKKQKTRDFCACCTMGSPCRATSNWRVARAPTCPSRKPPPIR